MMIWSGSISWYYMLKWGLWALLYCRPWSGSDRCAILAWFDCVCADKSCISKSGRCYPGSSVLRCPRAPGYFVIPFGNRCAAPETPALHGHYSHGQRQRLADCSGDGIFQKGGGNPRSNMPQIIDSDIETCQGFVHVVGEYLSSPQNLNATLTHALHFPRCISDQVLLSPWLLSCRAKGYLSSAGDKDFSLHGKVLISEILFITPPPFLL